MSGHSHAKTILHKKQISDKKRGQAFSKLSRLISVAARKGSNPETNPELRRALEEARNFNLPKENIERAIQRGIGKLEGTHLEEFTFEAYGLGKIAIIIEGITDNKNRALGEIKQILNQNGGKLVSEGAVKWMFEKKGCIVINIKNQAVKIKNDELELWAIEAGADDIYWHTDSILDIYTKIEELEKVKKNLEEKGIKIDSTSMDWVPKEMLEVNEKDRESCQKLFEALDENDAVQDIYSNLKT